MHRILTTLFLIAATVMPSFAIEEIQAGDVLNLDKCIEIALRNSPYISKAKANIRYSKANLGQSKSAWVPSISAGAGFSGSHSRVGRNNRDNNYFSADAMISQLIYDFGKTNASIGIQKFNTLASEYELEQTILETILAVKEAYFNVLAAKANKDIQIQNVEINERQYDMIKSYYDEGIRSRIDFVNADVNLSNAKIDMLSAQDRYCDAMVQLNQSLYITNNPDYSIAPVEQFNTDEMTPVTHIHSHTTFHDHEKLQNDEEEEITLEGIIKENEIVKEHKLNIFDKTFDEVLDIAKENRPDLKTYIPTKNPMQEMLKYTTRQWFPEISANGGYNYMRNDGKNIVVLVHHNFGFSG